MRGSVTKKGNKWYIVYTVGVRPDGTRKQKWESGFRTKKEAELALAKRIVEVETRSFVEPSNQTLSEFIEAWAKDKRAQVRESTWRSYNWNLKQHILPHLGHIQITQLKAPQIQHFYSMLRQIPRADGKSGTLSERSILHVHLLLHQILQRAVKWGYIASNPCDLVDKPKPIEPEFNVWTVDEVRLFLDHAKTDPLYIVFLLLFTTGMRIGEVLGLRWQDVNFEQKTISVKQQITFLDHGYKIGPPKTRAGKRTIDINDEVIEALRGHKAHMEIVKNLAGEQFKRELDLVCCTNKGTPLYRSNVTARYNSLINKAGLDRIRVHDARHTHATLFLEQGASLKVVQERLGHEKADVLLNRYAHVLPRMQREAVEVFGNRLFSREALAATGDTPVQDQPQL